MEAANDTLAPSPETTTETPENPRPDYGPGVPDDFDIDQYDIVNKDEYTVENLVFQGTVEGELVISPKIKARFRILTTNELQELEIATFKDRNENVRYSMNELSLRPMIRSIQALEVSGKRVEFPDDVSVKDEQIRAMSVPIVNELVMAYAWFNIRTNILVRGADLKN